MNPLKTLLQRLFLGYRETPGSYEPKAGARLTQQGGTAEQIHSALVLMQYNLKHGQTNN